MHNDFTLVPDKIEIKKEILSKFQLMNADFHKIHIGDVKKLVPNFFDKEKYVLHHENLQLYLRLVLKLKNIHCVLDFSQSQWLKPCIEFNIQKLIEAKTNGDKGLKALYKLINNAVSGKTMENLRSRTDVKPVINDKDYLKWTSKPSYMSQKYLIMI